MKTAMNFFKTLVIMIALFAFTNNSHAQGNGANSGGPANQVPGTGNGAGGPGDGNGPGNGAGQGNPQNGKNNGDSVPLDGGLGILLAGAAFYGVKKLRKS